MQPSPERLSSRQGPKAPLGLRRLLLRRRILLGIAGVAALQVGTWMSNFCFAALDVPSSSVMSVSRRPIAPEKNTLVGSHSQLGLLLDRQSRAAGRLGQVKRKVLPEALDSVFVLLNEVPQQVAELGSLGALYFFAIYVIAECLALPATPLTLSAGYLFGLPQGIALTILSGSVAAAIAFTLSRTLLRPQIEKIAAESEDFQRINKAVEKEGFKIIVLLRLSPLLPFSISNYIFGLTSVSFSDFLAATLLGFTPGTAALITLSSTFRDVALAGDGADQSWFVPAVGIFFTFGLLKLVTDIARETVDEAVKSERIPEQEKVAI